MAHCCHAEELQNYCAEIVQTMNLEGPRSTRLPPHLPQILTSPSIPHRGRCSPPPPPPYRGGGNTGELGRLTSPKRNEDNSKPNRESTTMTDTSEGIRAMVNQPNGRKCGNCGKPVHDNGSFACEECQEMEPTCLECGKWSPGWRTCEDCRPSGWNFPLTA
jgi:hypothetical protein